MGLKGHPGKKRIKETKQADFFHPHKKLKKCINIYNPLEDEQDVKLLYPSLFNGAD